MTKAGERLIKAAKEAAELARTHTAKREWVEWRVVHANDSIIGSAPFASELSAREYAKAWFTPGEWTIIKTRVTVIE